MSVMLNLNGNVFRHPRLQSSQAHSGRDRMQARRGGMKGEAVCGTEKCPVCKYAHKDLDRTDVWYPYQNKEEVQAAVESARLEHLDAQGRVNII
jgi:hypothetical protein